MLRTLSLLKRNAFTAVGSKYDINSYDRPSASVKLFELGVRTPGGLFFARCIDFRRFSYAKPSDFRRNFYIDSIE